jgi:hypothetical protein
VSKTLKILILRKAIFVILGFRKKRRHIKNLPVKGLCGRCLSELIDWN